MELFKDKDEALKRLDQLLREEADEEEPEEEFDEDEFEDDLDEDDLDEDEPEEEVIYHNYSNNYGRNRVYNADRTDTDLEEFSDQVYQPKKRRELLVLTAIALALVGAIMGVLAWWVARYL